MVAGSGCPVDRVIADFVAGSAERLVRENQEHDILLIEGAGQSGRSALRLCDAWAVARFAAGRAFALLPDGS